MLTLGTALNAVLRSKATEACWLLELYYNDDDAVTPVRVSDVDRTIGGNDYLGLVRSWGSLHQSADLVEFTSSTGTVSITLDNTENTILGGRFSDLFAIKNIANRKWILYLSADGEVSTDSIGSGIISDDIKATDKNVQLQLLNNESNFDTEFPKTVVDVETYPNVPDNNIDKLIPMAYGDFDRTISEEGANADRALVKGRFPAIIVDKTDIDALPDIQPLNTLRTRQIYMKMGEYYAACKSANVIATAATPIITFGGPDWYLYIPMVAGDIDYDAMTDRDYSEFKAFQSGAGGAELTKDFEIPLVGNVGTFSALVLGIGKKRIVTNTATDPNLSARFDPLAGAVKPYVEFAWDANDEDLALTQATLPVQGDIITVSIQDENLVDQIMMEIYELIVELTMAPLQTFTRKKTLYSVEYIRQARTARGRRRL